MVKLTAQAAGTPWPVRLGERLTAFGNLSLALLLALLTGRLLELSGVLVTTEVPRNVGRVIVAALRSDLVLFLELLVFLLPLFLACRMILRGKNADVRVYGGLGSPCGSPSRACGRCRPAARCRASSPTTSQRTRRLSSSRIPSPASDRRTRCRAALPVPSRSFTI